LNFHPTKCARRLLLLSLAGIAVFLVSVIVPTHYTPCPDVITFDNSTIYHQTAGMPLACVPRTCRLLSTQRTIDFKLLGAYLLATCLDRQPFVKAGPRQQRPAQPFHLAVWPANLASSHSPVLSQIPLSVFTDRLQGLEQMPSFTLGRECMDDLLRGGTAWASSLLI